MIKTIYLLTHIWSDFDTHYETVGVYETKELAEKALKEYSTTNTFSMYDMYKDSELVVDEVPLNHYTWEMEDLIDGSENKTDI